LGTKAGQVNRQVRTCRLAQLERARVGIVGLWSAFAVEYLAHSANGFAKAAGGSLERHAVEALDQCFCAGTQAQNVAAAADVSKGSGAHGDRASGAAPNGENAGHDGDLLGFQRDLGQDQGGIKAPALRHAEQLIAEFVGQNSHLHNHFAAGFHRGQGYAPALVSHYSSCICFEW